MTKAAANNPFFEADFSKFMDMSKIMEMPKMMKDMRMPGLDFEAVMSAQRKNMQAIASANQTAVEGMQAFLRRQSEIMRQGMQESSQLLNEVLTSSTPEEKVAKQAEMTKSVIDRLIGNSKELTEMLTKSNFEALEVISQRMGEGVEELRGMIKNGKAEGE